MNTLRVWAPRARTLELEVGGQRFPLVPERLHGPSGPGDEPEGWFAATVPLPPNTDYALFVDGRGPFPDPRSRFQPEGVHGRSRVIDPGAFVWTDEGFRAQPFSQALVYELHVGTFTPEGTFEAAIGKLDHLARLGVTHVEIMPVAEFSGGYGWGYDGVDLFAPHHLYGGPEGLARLVDACHGHGLAVLLDVVYNHLGPSGNYLAQFGPYFTESHATPWGEAVNFDHRGCDAVRRYVIENALTWLRDYHIDGLRLDAVDTIIDTSALHILEELTAAVRALGLELGRPLVVVAENDANDPRPARPLAQGGYGLDAQWCEDFHHALHAFLTGEGAGYYRDFGRLEHLARAFTSGFVYDGRYSRYRGKTHGREAADLGGERFVVYLQNHDQVGNRPAGDRITAILPARRVKLGAALVFVSPFVPMLFQGEEWGASTPFPYFTDHAEHELAESVRNGRRRQFVAFGWSPEAMLDPQDRATFERSKLDWRELEEPAHRDLLDWYRALARLRRERPELGTGPLDRVHVRFDEAEQWIVVERERVHMLLNASASPRAFVLEPGARSLLLGSDDAIVLEGDRLLLPPESVAFIVVS